MERRLAAIMFSDIVGYSRLMELDEDGTIARLKAQRDAIFAPCISTHGGRIVKSIGDGLLVEFPSAVEAVKCAVDIQTSVSNESDYAPGERRFAYRIGISLGDILIDEGDTFGSGVNIAARLERLAKPGGLCISDITYDQLGGPLNLKFEDGGEQKIKNISRPVRIWHWTDKAVDQSALAAEPAMRATRPSIAVLPFRSATGASEQDPFAAGISEDIRTALSKYRLFLVSSGSSAATFDTGSINVKSVGRDLAVRYVVIGSVRRSGDRVRVNAQLAETERGANIWAERYDGDLIDVFDVQDTITRSIVTSIAPEISDAEHARALQRQPESLDAWELFHRGMWHAYRLTPEDLSKADQFLRQSIEADPNFAAAWSGLSFVVQHRAAFGWSQNKEARWSETLEVAKGALALDPQDALAHAVIARALLADRRIEPAMEAAGRALRFNENSSFANVTSAMALLSLDRASEALERIEQALRLSPRDPLRWTFEIARGCSLAKLERYPEAEAALQSASMYDSAGFWPHVHLANLYVLMGRLVEARAAVAEALKRNPGLSISHFVNYSALLSDASRAEYVENLQKSGLDD